jgi:hypothetical protein
MERERDVSGGRGVNDHDCVTGSGSNKVGVKRRGEQVKDNQSVTPASRESCPEGQETSACP